MVERVPTASRLSPFLVPITKQNFDFLLNCLFKTQEATKSAKPSAICTLPGGRKQRNSLRNRQRKGKATTFCLNALLTPQRPPQLKLPRGSWPSHSLSLCHCHHVGGFHPSLPGDVTSELKPPASLKLLPTCRRQACACTAVKKRHAAPSRDSQAAGRACSACRAAYPNCMLELS